MSDPTTAALKAAEQMKADAKKKPPQGGSSTTPATTEEKPRKPKPAALTALAVCRGQLERLTAEERHRVLHWLEDEFGTRWEVTTTFPGLGEPFVEVGGAGK